MEIGIVWADYDSNYTVSNMGDVYSKRSKQLLSIVKSGSYSSVNLYGKMVYVHVMVASAFFGIPKGLVVNHIDGNKERPCLDNLEVCTNSENMKHAYRTGLHVSCKGEKHGLSKLNEAMVISIKLMLNEGCSLSEVAKIADVSRSAIGHISRGATWSHVHV